jgi:uncharacterized protein (DUF1800 family)
MSSVQHYIAANRFAYGANPATIAAMGQDPRNWLLAQLQAMSLVQLNKVTQGQWSSKQALEAAAKYKQKKDQLEQTAAIQDADKDQDTAELKKVSPVISMSDKQQLNRHIEDLTEFTIRQAIQSDVPFYWHLVDFFSNHFSVSSSNLIMRALAPTMDLEAIAPNITGRFSDMLFAVQSHPAMLHYLNNVQSVGPNTPLATKRKNKGLNENLAREILELHTLGVKSTYKQADVTELAKAITGWSVGGFKRGESMGFLFREPVHEPGTRQILAKTYAQKGVEQGKAILFDLANHRDTAKHVSSKLVRHFVSDEVDESQVEAMIQSWLNSQGDLTQVITTMLQHPASWTTTNRKLKTPRELVISVCRSAQIESLRPNFIRSLTTMGQKPFNAGSPAGYKDTQDAWSGPAAMLSRIEWSAYVSRTLILDPEQFARQALGPLLRDTTLAYIKKAESKEQALTLLMMSPEFQRR